MNDCHGCIKRIEITFVGFTIACIDSTTHCMASRAHHYEMYISNHEEIKGTVYIQRWLFDATPGIGRDEVNSIV